ncbi:MAG: DUF3145 domain-containing protein [Actinobacteria bacterium]|uniref:DUF3145 domain-containing protein n=1 Tax=Propionicimonas sp. T2.31MG-18 TaxID=3157620 RepID=UPI0035ED3E3F|nr:DUF3145 domain-containing protein [Actinomycetota bacterium]
MSSTRGIIQIHSAPIALRPHLEWAVGAVLGAPVEFAWTSQPAEQRSLRAEYAWHGRTGLGAELASALRGCQRARFEVTEDPSAGHEGMRWAYTPRLGVFAAATGVHGDIMVHEDRLKQAILADALGRQPLAEGIADLLGARWDDELEAFRQAGDGAPVRWLHQVG